ncbi:hypothetical protein C1645_790523, partial [Glomus cerebriforme]
LIILKKITIEWIKIYLETNDDKNPIEILELMKHHEQNKIWFTSLIGFFYQFGIGCDLNRKRR